MTAPLLDMGTAICDGIMDGIERALADLVLDKPAIFGQFAGAAIPAADACDGMIWVRVGTVYPTFGDGQQFTEARWDRDVPAWCYPIEVGVLWCHANITEDGGFIDASRASDFARRDGQYRGALFHAVANLWWPAARSGPLANAVMGQSVQPWQPIGPEGGYSGGLLVVNVIAGAMFVPG